MTDTDLIWHIIEQEFPDYRKAMEIHNPFRKPLWDENLEHAEKEKLYNYYVIQYEDIQKRFEELSDFSEQKMVALRKKYGLSATSDKHLNRQQSKDRDKDDIIGETAEQLIKWGFARRTVYEKLAKPSANTLHRIAPDGLPLSGDRIEQIHEEWRERLEKHNIERIGSHWSFDRWRYTKRSLVRGRPEAPLNELIIKLLNNKGEWLYEVSEHHIQGENELSKKAERFMSLRPRLRSHRKK